MHDVRARIGPFLRTSNDAEPVTQHIQAKKKKPNRKTQKKTKNQTQNKKKKTTRTPNY